MNGVDVESIGLFNSNDAESQYEELEGQVSNQHQNLAPYPHERHLLSSDDEAAKRVTRQESVETSNPRGFFYSFDYPVPYIKSKNARQSPFDNQQQASSSVVEQIVRANNNGNEKQFRDARHAAIDEKKYDAAISPTRVNRNRGSIRFKYT